jgi:hypothetical protein
MPIPPGMRVLATPEARQLIRDRGGMLFLRLRLHGAGLRTPLPTLAASTEPPGPEALDFQRFDANGFVVFLPPGLRPPFEIQLKVRGWVRRRIQAFWNGSVFAL